ncbi:hypothetical protein AK812_SmicGene31190 [Symbiodinium microadriaticum]|uniref:Uncharacterized protein n=1 Tax=Symbiodinium microadriaticum TaxID=2951 RepID=A0A1Q9CXD9_SYMMI|nr:hypothetical protein AK812_SmicGene31190 [Symbiodinium microadriaticum]
MKSSRREATGKCLIPAGHSRRALALLRRKRCLRPHNRHLQRCEMCQQLRRIGRWWRPPRKLLQAGAASCDKGIAGAAALNHQDVQASGKLGATMCKTKNLDGRELMTLDYQKLSVVLWGVVKSLQKRVEKLEKKKRGRSN